MYIILTTPGGRHPARQRQVWRPHPPWQTPGVMNPTWQTPNMMHPPWQPTSGASTPDSDSTKVWPIQHWQHQLWRIHSPHWKYITHPHFDHSYQVWIYFDNVNVRRLYAWFTGTGGARLHVPQQNYWNMHCFPSWQVMFWRCRRVSQWMYVFNIHPLYTTAPPKHQITVKVYVASIQVFSEKINKNHYLVHFGWYVHEFCR